MRHTFGNTIVLALGGSIVHPDRIDVDFLKAFKPFAMDVVKSGRKLVIVIGGGKLARVFQDAAHGITQIDDEDKDWLGIHSTRLNAHLLRTIFKDIADPVVVDERYKIEVPHYPITIASGWRPGWSTDYIAVQLAIDYDADAAIIAGKPAFVYDKDPQTNADAKPIKEISWADYRKLIPEKWTPGMGAPVDPVASALGEKSKMKAIIINGKDLENFKELIDGNDFTGTIIA
jgi:uridylate kinase